MKHTVLFTGAGASKAFGYPLTNELMREVRDDLRSGILFRKTVDHGARHRRKQLNSYLKKLLPGFRDAEDVIIPPIESVRNIVGSPVAITLEAVHAKEVIECERRSKSAQIWRRAFFGHRKCFGRRDTTSPVAGSRAGCGLMQSGEAHP